MYWPVYEYVRPCVRPCANTQMSKEIGCVNLILYMLVINIWKIYQLE